jgi:small subunit ribosomal protein S2
MVKIEDLLEAGVHFGHRVTKWNPRMAPFIYGERNGIHIIDLIQTVQFLNETTNFLKQLKKGSANRSEAGAEIRGGKEVLFVGTKKQASTLVELAANKINTANTSDTNEGKKTSGLKAHYVNHRWLGGLLTNWATMKVCIDHLNDLESREIRGEMNNLPKKERAILKKQYEKLNKFFGGIKTMKDQPNLVIILGQDTEMNAVRECNKLQNMAELNSPNQGKGQTELSNFKNLRTITLLDTNCDPLLADLFIPANDDSTKSLEFILNTLTEALC